MCITVRMPDSSRRAYSCKHLIQFEAYDVVSWSTIMLSKGCLKRSGFGTLRRIRAGDVSRKLVTCTSASLR